ncbi:MAG: RNA methyltransferase [Alphaproteobacteria bacterium]|jgi:tRNA G18 (ribose-2'-O)-methylase SpoU|nr:RNA methyltransferase [Alphaproteobacteria bacterium]MBT5860034.1 RNA methyltransferase [Alphaproteobacteria bacterium]
MRGYFGIGVEGISKPMNAGNLFRTAHAFGASFIFTVDSEIALSDIGRSDTSDSWKQTPFYRYDSVPDMDLPKDCSLVGLEFIEDAVALPSFRHPPRAAYVLGRELGSLSPEIQERCAFIVQIPTRFCVNVGTAGAIVMYDRMISMGRFAERPVGAGAPVPASAVPPPGRVPRRSIG